MPKKASCQPIYVWVHWKKPLTFENLVSLSAKRKIKHGMTVEYSYAWWGMYAAPQFVDIYLWVLLFCLILCILKLVTEVGLLNLKLPYICLTQLYVRACACACTCMCLCGCVALTPWCAHQSQAFYLDYLSLGRYFAGSSRFWWQK